MASRDPRAKSNRHHEAARDPSSAVVLDAPDETSAWLGERLRRVALGLTAMLAVARPFWPGEDAPTGSGQVWTIALLGTSALAIVSMLLSGTTRLRWSWADAAVLALMVLVGLSASHAPDRRPAITMAWEWGGLGLLYYLARNLPRTRAESAALLGALAASAVAVAAYGLYQVPVEFPLFRRLLLSRPELVYARMGITPGSPSADALRSRVFSNEPFSTFALPNSLAGFLVGPLALGFAVAMENLRREGKGSRLVALALAAVPGLALLICLILTKSRSAWIGLIAALMVLAWRGRRVVSRRVLMASALGLGGLIGVLVVAGVATRQLDVEILTQTTKSLRYRWEYWVGAWGVITDAPSPYASAGLTEATSLPGSVDEPESHQVFWSGLGPANFAGPYLRHKRPEASEEVQDPHNMVLEVWAASGVFAAFALLAALGIGLRETLGPSRGPVSEGETLLPDDPSAPPIGSGWLIGASGSGWLAVWAMGKLDPMSAYDLLFRWMILGLAWGGAVVLSAQLWRRLPIPAAGAGVGLLALGINLMAAGGIGIPPVAMALWLLLALGMNLRDDRPCGRLRVVGGLGPAVALACVWAMLAGTFYGAVMPAWKAQAALDEGDRAMSARPAAFEAARKAYAEAIEADRYDVRPWVALASLEYTYWRSPEGLARKKSDWQRVGLAIDKALERPWRNPDNLGLRRRQAAFARMILADLPDDAKPFELLGLKTTIVRACRNAARIYPTSASLRAELAQASADVGMFADAAREARQALQLDGLTPHADKKLRDDLRSYLKAQVPRWEAMAKAPLPVAPGGRKP